MSSYKAPVQPAAIPVSARPHPVTRVSTRGILARAGAKCWGFGLEASAVGQFDPRDRGDRGIVLARIARGSSRLGSMGKLIYRETGKL